MALDDPDHKAAQQRARAKIHDETLPNSIKATQAQYDELAGMIREAFEDRLKTKVHERSFQVDASRFYDDSSFEAKALDIHLGDRIVAAEPPKHFLVGDIHYDLREAGPVPNPRSASLHYNERTKAWCVSRYQGGPPHGSVRKTAEAPLDSAAIRAAVDFILE